MKWAIRKPYKHLYFLLLIEMNIRKPNVSEIDTLNSMIYKSKGFWGYKQEMLDTFIDKYGLKKENFDYNQQISVNGTEVEIWLTKVQ